MSSDRNESEAGSSYEFSAKIGTLENGDTVAATTAAAINGIASELEALDIDDGRPKVLLMGLKRSGKSSIQKVVFHKMSANETLFLEATNKVIKEPISNNSFVQFSVWDIPGQIEFLDEDYDLEAIFGGIGAIVFVIDAQDEYVDALEKLIATVTKAHSINPEIYCEVLIHKVDGLSDEMKMEIQHDISTRAFEELGSDNVQLTFYLTSIYDHSIFEAFSKIIQKLIVQLPHLENLLNMFVERSNAEKAFFFDVVSKIYIATDSSPVDTQSFELCCDMIDLAIDVSGIYGIENEKEQLCFDDKSGSIVRMNNNTVLYMREVDHVLALVCILREENYPRPPDSVRSSIPFADIQISNAAIVAINFHTLRKGVKQIFKVREEYRQLEIQDKVAAQQNGNGANSTPI